MVGGEAKPVCESSTRNKIWPIQTREEPGEEPKEPEQPSQRQREYSISQRASSSETKGAKGEGKRSGEEPATS